MPGMERGYYRVLAMPVSLEQVGERRGKEKVLGRRGRAETWSILSVRISSMSFIQTVMKASIQKLRKANNQRRKTS